MGWGRRAFPLEVPVRLKKHDEMTPTDAPLVSVEWEDITGLDNWNEDDGPFQPTSIKSVGWLIEDGPKWLVIARDYDHTNEKWSSIVVIPRLPPVVMIHAGAPKLVGSEPGSVFDDVHEERVERPLPPEDQYTCGGPLRGLTRAEAIAKGWVFYDDGSVGAPMEPCSGPDPYPDPPAPDTGSWPVWTNQNPFPVSTDGTIPGQP